MPVTLGGLTLRDFEIPGGIKFGGRQAAIVHRLPGGGRVIDTLGPDDCDIIWHGVLSGSGAADRARELDALRRDGSTVPLAWDSFRASVVVGELLLEFRSPWWIPYAIRCIVAASSGITPRASDGSALMPALLADIAAASIGIDVGSAASVLTDAQAIQTGTDAYVSSVTAISDLTAQIDQGIVDAESGLSGSTLTDITEAAAQLAKLTGARCYLLRAQRNLLQAGY